MIEETSALYKQAQRRLGTSALEELREHFVTDTEFWAAMWKASQQAYHSSGSETQCWQNYDDEDRARKYYEAVKKIEDIDPITESIFDMLESDWNVLDIGAGPGNYTVPIAQRVRSVTAVEPARGMAKVLQENFDTEGLTNTRIINKKWDDITVSEDLDEGFDLVLCSYAFGMVDIEDMLDKVLAVAKNHVVFVWFAGPQNWDHDAMVLWPLLHGEDVTPAPRGEVIFNYLYARGIFADVKMLHKAFTTRYDSVDAALEVYRSRFLVDENDEEMNAKLRSYIESVFVAEGNQLSHRCDPTAMRISFSMRNL